MDDSEDIRDPLRRILERRGHQVVTYENGYDALMNLGHGEYDAIFLDMNMPGLNGPMVYGAISVEYPRYVDRIIVISGDPSTFRGFLEDNRLECLGKPFTEAQIVTRLDSLSGLTSQVSPPGESPGRAEDGGSGAAGDRAVHARVLIVSDSTEVTEPLEPLLRDRGCDVQTVRNGYQGLLKIRKVEHDLVLLDLDLPGVDGSLIVRAIAREMPERLSKIVILGEEGSRHELLLRSLGLLLLPRAVGSDALNALLDVRLQRAPGAC